MGLDKSDVDLAVVPEEAERVREYGFIGCAQGEVARREGGEDVLRSAAISCAAFSGGEPVRAENPVASRDLHVLVEETTESVSSEHADGRAGRSSGVANGRALLQ